MYFTRVTDQVWQLIILKNVLRSSRNYALCDYHHAQIHPVCGSGLSEGLFLTPPGLDY